MGLEITFHVAGITVGNRIVWNTQITGATWKKRKTPTAGLRRKRTSVILPTPPHARRQSAGLRWPVLNSFNFCDVTHFQVKYSRRFNKKIECWCWIETLFYSILTRSKWCNININGVYYEFMLTLKEVKHFRVGNRNVCYCKLA